MAEKERCANFHAPDETWKLFSELYLHWLTFVAPPIRCGVAKWLTHLRDGARHRSPALGTALDNCRVRPCQTFIVSVARVPKDDQVSQEQPFCEWAERLGAGWKVSGARPMAAEGKNDNDKA